MEYKCQSCSFSIFNRRYPKCESCGVFLADGIALSSQEREALFEEDRLASEMSWREKQKNQGDQPHATDDSSGLLIAVTLAASAD